MENLKVWLRNSVHAHERMMVNFLRKRNWVVFYLEPQARTCRGECWLKLYEQSK